MSSLIIESDALEAFRKDIFSEYRESHQNILTELFLEATTSFEKFPLNLEISQIEAYFSQIRTIFQKCVSITLRHATPLSQDRYKDIIPYSYNCFTYSKVPEIYFNASLMTAARQRYILTQGPMDGSNGKASTISDFWAAVIDQKCRLIVNLVSVQEIPIKCSEYWSFDEKICVPEAVERSISTSGENIQFLNTLWSIENVAEVEKTDYWTIRRICLKGANDKEHVVHQIHYLQWPDRSTPNALSFSQLFQKVEEYNSDLYQDYPIMVHCSAGIGRSGSFVTVHSLIRKINNERSKFLRNELTVNIPETVMAIRMIRKGAVTDVEQLGAIFQCLDSYVVELKRQTRSEDQDVDASAELVADIELH